MASCSIVNSDTPPRTISTIRPWSEDGEEYLVLEKFPSLHKRFESGLDCLTPEQRSQLRTLAQRRESELRGSGAAYLTPLAHKISLLPGANLADLTLDAVVNASNHWLTPGKGRSLINLLKIYSSKICPFQRLVLVYWRSVSPWVDVRWAGLSSVRATTSQQRESSTQLDHRQRMSGEPSY